MSECAGEDCTHVGHLHVNHRAERDSDHRFRRPGGYPRTERIRLESRAEMEAWGLFLEKTLRDAQAASEAALFHKRYIAPGDARHALTLPPDARCSPVLGVHRPWCTCVIE